MIDAICLEDRVSSALETNPYVSHRTLRFETSEGRVTLRGIVSSYFQKQMAQEATPARRRRGGDRQRTGGLLVVS